MSGSSSSTYMTFRRPTDGKLREFPDDPSVYRKPPPDFLVPCFTPDVCTPMRADWILSERTMSNGEELAIGWRHHDRKVVGLRVNQREEVATMLPATASKSATPFRPLHTRNAGFSETLLVDAHMRHLEPHEHAFYEGDAQTHIYRIKSGMMRLYRLLADGRRQVIAFRLPGHLIGLGEQETQFCSAEALTEVVLQCVPLSIVYRRMQEEPQFGSELVRCLAVELAETRNQVAFLNRRSALEKLATFILGFLT